MDRPPISKENECYYHAKFLVDFYPDSAIDCLADSENQEMVTKIVKNRCRAIGQPYGDIIRLAQDNNWDEIRCKKAMAGERSSAHPSPAQLSAPPLVQQPPVIPFVNANFPNPNAPPSPALTSASKSFAPAEFITVVGEDVAHLTMGQSLDERNYIRPDVLDRLPSLKRELVARMDQAFPNSAYNAGAPIPQVQLTFYRCNTPNRKTRRELFFLKDIDTADVLVNFRPSPNHDVPGGPPSMNIPSYYYHQASQQEGFPSIHKHPDYAFPGTESDHPSSVTTMMPSRHPEFGTSPGSVIARGIYRVEHDSPVPRHSIPTNSSHRAPPSAINHHQSHMQNNARSVSRESIPMDTPSNKVTVSYSVTGKKATTSSSFEICPTGELLRKALKKACRRLGVDKNPDIDVRFVPSASTDDTLSHTVSLDEIRDVWATTLEWLKENRSDKNPEFKISFESIDESDDG